MKADPVIEEHLAAVLIPVYKAEIKDSEWVSLKQCIKLLHAHPIIFFAPKGLNTTIYEEFCRDKIPFEIRYFNESYFYNIAGYNKLMLAPDFYKTFLNYKFILIYQLDALVFKDELLYWCSMNYDYIGAPNLPHQNMAGELQFLKNYSALLHFMSKYLLINHQVSNVGNGGFSLRKTRSCYWLLKILKKKAADWEYNEDGFFKYWGNLLFPLFKLPDDRKALHFSVEHSPRESLVKLEHKPPFGCHAFEKFSLETWLQYMLKDDEK